MISPQVFEDGNRSSTLHMVGCRVSYKTNFCEMIGCIFCTFYLLDAHDEEEAKSEGSTGSEWLVVPEEKVLESTEPVNSSIPSSSMQL